jgi:2,4-dienoyl-CoA reductase-like NADH-dependent reductase (Old Yellow Enzyme family)
VEPLARINGFILSQGAVPGVQLAHAGRKGSAARPWEGGHHLDEGVGGWATSAPSPVPFGAKLGKTPHELDRDGLQRIRDAYTSAARRAEKAGFRWLEIHAGHGYLLHQFLSPLSNLRTDGYGGSLENRSRLLLEVVEAVRNVWPSGSVLGVRLSCTDWVEGGLTLEDTVEVSRLVAERGVDLVDASSGFVTPDHARYPFGPGWQVGFAERIRREVGVATGAVGMITTAQQAEEIITSGKADVVFLARTLLSDPHWPARAKAELEGGSRLSLLPITYSHWV